MSAQRLRPRSVGELLDHSVELYRRNLPTFLGIYAVAALPFVALATPLMVRSLTTAPGAAGEPATLLTAGLGLALFVLHTVLLSPLATGALTIAVSERYLGRPTSVLAAYRGVWRQARPLVGLLALLTGPLLGLLLLVLVLVVLASLALLRWSGGEQQLAAVVGLATVLWVPALALVLLAYSTVCGFVPAAVVLEGRRWGGLWRSLDLAWPCRGRILALYGVLQLLVLLLTAYVRLPATLLGGAAGLDGSPGSALLTALATQLGILLVDPLRLVGVTLTYYDCRVRLEAFDLELLAGDLAAATEKGS
ncbi:MAG: hypothetical protein IT204_10455 [Fimbriimonadaceae bacterium]|nr:hypothetical protein [Fimbriimonadaceae bacterium]